MSVGEEFQAFRDRYNIGQTLMGSISYRYKRITRCLNKDFRSNDSETANSLYVGSYGRDTAAVGVSDLDMAYILPTHLYSQYDNYLGNGQSALLQAVKRSIQNTYPTSESFGDGQVVVINFSDGITFEVLPVFNASDGGFIFPNANGGGSWKSCYPRSEIQAVHDRNLACNRNLKALCRMMRVWRDFNKVPMTGALIDTLAYQFIEMWEYRDKSFLYHDFMARDFLKYLYDLPRDQTYWRMPGSGSYAWKTGVFWTNAKADYEIAVRACEMQSEVEEAMRREKWIMVFGSTFP